MECRIAKPRSAALRGLALLIRVDVNEITYLGPIALRPPTLCGSSPVRQFVDELVSTLSASSI